MFQHPLNKLQMSPAMQALVTVAENLLISAIIAALIAGAQYLSANQRVDVPSLLWIVGIAAGLSIGHGIAMFFVAKGQAPLGDALDSFVAQLQVRAPVPTQPMVSRAVTTPAANVVLPPGSSPIPPRASAVFAQPVPGTALSGTTSMSHISFGDTNAMPAVQPPTTGA